MINCCHRRSKTQSPPSLFTLGQLLLHPPVLTQAVLHNDDRSSSNNTTVTPPATLCQYWSISTISAAYPKLIYPPVLPPQMIDLLIQHSWSKSSKPCLTNCYYCRWDYYHEFQINWEKTWLSSTIEQKLNVNSKHPAAGLHSTHQSNHVSRFYSTRFYPTYVLHLLLI